MPRPASPPISVIAHPPERGRSRSLAPAQAGASCCCCCCCLHSVGAVIGAAIAPVFGRRPTRRTTQEEEDYGDHVGGVRGGAVGRMSAVGLFWLTVLVLSGLSVVGGLEAAGRNGANGTGRIWVAGVGFIIFLPAVLLAAALVSAFVLAVSRRPDKFYQLGRLGWITVGTVVGMILGGLPMGCLLLALLRK